MAGRLATVLILTAKKFGANVTSVGPRKGRLMDESNYGQLREVTLKDGSIVPEPAVAAIHLLLESLINKDLLAFYELVMLSRDSNHQIFSEVQRQTLTSLSLIQSDNRPHQLIAEVVRNSVEGDLSDMRLVNPLKES
jgi:hypothetical protein